ncbi:DUF3226 domain-containing protein [Bosea eneae]|uniref:DUF3226 domain-containing protein n=1 Tax=Bosea eneae TaxID=151454 RepID=A0ABW0INC1_9HYPH
MGKDAVLLVEGNDDLHVISGLLKYHQFPQVFEIKEQGGIDNLLQTVPVQIKGSNIRAIGLVVDADLNLTARWQSLRAVLRAAGYEIPDAPVAGGLVIAAENLPAIGVWLMPDNSLPGMLEGTPTRAAVLRIDAWG